MRAIKVASAISDYFLAQTFWWRHIISWPARRPPRKLCFVIFENAILKLIWSLLNMAYYSKTANIEDDCFCDGVKSRSRSSCETDSITTLSTVDDYFDNTKVTFRSAKQHSPTLSAMPKKSAMKKGSISSPSQFHDQILKVGTEQQGLQQASSPKDVVAVRDSVLGKHPKLCSR
jgi:hypothetical protein